MVNQPRNLIGTMLIFALAAVGRLLSETPGSIGSSRHRIDRGALRALYSVQRVVLNFGARARKQRPKRAQRIFGASVNTS